jgi:crossover junction endodeoxyribonuclease RusA
MNIELPWPPAELFPNMANRRHGSFGYHRKAKPMRTLAWGLSVQAMQREGIPIRGRKEADEIVLRYEFTPPMRAGKVADEDNVLSALKPARDGIADALGVNDSKFRGERPVWRDREGEGKVVITF